MTTEAIEHRLCRQRTAEEQEALAALAPTTGAPYDGYYFPPGCTGYIREDIDWGEQLTHDPARPCLVHLPDLPHSRLTVNVTDFGAKGEGVTDDTEALQAAWDALGQIARPAGGLPTNSNTRDR